MLDAGYTMLIAGLVNSCTFKFAPEQTRPYFHAWKLAKHPVYWFLPFRIIFEDIKVGVTFLKGEFGCARGNWKLLGATPKSYVVPKGWMPLARKWGEVLKAI